MPEQHDKATIISMAIIATFGGNSGMLWLDSLMPRVEPLQFLFVRRQPAWWVTVRTDLTQGL